MPEPFSFIQKRISLILFVLLESISIAMFVNSQPFHTRTVVRVFNSIAGPVLAMEKEIGDYLSLKEQNEDLLSYNTFLLNTRQHVADTTTKLGEIQTNDSTRYVFFHADVVRNDIYREKNYLVINKGSADGILPNMGVFGTSGIVGIVAEVGTHYSSVVSLLSPYSVISARLKDSGHTATVTWDGSDSRFGLMFDIPTHITLHQGDTIVTSGFSSSFPADMLIGTVENVYTSPSRGFNKAQIRYATNFGTLRHVFIVGDCETEEIETLYKATDNE